MSYEMSLWFGGSIWIALGLLAVYRIVRWARAPRVRGIDGEQLRRPR